MATVKNTYTADIMAGLNLGIFSVQTSSSPYGYGGIMLTDEYSGFSGTGDLCWIMGVTDRGGVGSAGQNAFIIKHAPSSATLTGSNNWWDTSKGTELLTIDDSGNTGILDGTPDYKLSVNGTIYSSGSSLEYKTDVEDYLYEPSKIMNLLPVEYVYKEEYKHLGKRLVSGKQIGLIAEDTAKVCPELAITIEEDGEQVVRNVDYEKLSVVLIGGIKDMYQRIEKLKSKGGQI